MFLLCELVLGAYMSLAKRQQGLEVLQVITLNESVVPRSGGIAKNALGVGSRSVRAHHMGQVLF